MNRNKIPNPPKVVIAVIDGQFTKGKEYNAVPVPGFPYSEVLGYSFYATSDNGLPLYCLEKHCSHMGNEDWIIKEREA
jgi:hypothetical protein